MAWTHPVWGNFEWRGGSLTGRVAGVEVGLDSPEAAVQVEGVGELDAWALGALPQVAAKMRAERMWSGASVEALAGALRVLAVHARRSEAKLRVLLRWDGRVDLSAVVAPDGEVHELRGHFELASRNPGFVHRYFGAFQDRGTHYEASVDGLSLALDLPEAVALLEPYADPVAWARGLTREAAEQIATCATRHWAMGDVDAVAAGLSPRRVSASWLDECVTIHFDWGSPAAGSPAVVDARVRVRAQPRSPGYRVDRPVIEVHPAAVVLPPIGELTLHEEGGVSTYESFVDGVALRFDDAGLASAAYAVSQDLATLRAAAREHAARSLFETWHRAWREPNDDGDEATLESRLILRSIEIDADGRCFRFDDGGAFLGHLVVVEQRDDAWGEASLEG